MIRPSVRFATIFVPAALFASQAFAQAAESGSADAGVSKVRIVRLSEVRGQVTVDRNTGSGFETAMTNLPIVEKNRIRTDDGVAEVEFEDNSTLRLAPDTVVEFPELDRLSTGATVSSVHVLRGTAYVSLLKTKGNEFDVSFGGEKTQLAPGTHLRVQVGDPESELAVLDGNVKVEGPTGTVDITHKQTVSFMMQDPPQMAKKIDAQPFDSWDDNAAKYHEHAAVVASLRQTGYTYGAQDLAYYGSFMDAGGCGQMWRPYFASAAWEPFANGAWAYYPGAGYSWVSPYPWGWMPYHSGTWAFCPGTGWGWQPGGGGGSWIGLSNSTLLVRPNGSRNLPIQHPLPPRPPRGGEPTLTVVNLRPLVVSDLAAKGPDRSFVFRRDSAGLGVPRGLGRLNGFSRETVSRGMASTPVYTTAPQSTLVAGRMQAGAMGNPGRPNSGVMNSGVSRASTATVEIHRGIAPPAGGFAANGGWAGATRGANPGMSPGVGQGSMSPSMSSRTMSAPSMASGGGHMSAGGSAASSGARGH